MPKSGPIKWHGGKSYLAPKIRALMPKHTRYAEPFFGGGAVLLSGDGEGVAEFANDLNFALTNFWNVLKGDEWFAEFKREIEATPFSQWEFNKTGYFENAEKHVAGPHTAATFFVRNRQSRQGLGRDFATPTSRLRRNMNEQVSAWLSAIEGLPEFHARLKRVEIRCQDAKDFIRDLDSEETCFYCDPPYMHETRTTTKEYGEHEMTPEQHETLLHHLHRIKGKFLLSGYHSKMYDSFAAVAKWRCVEFKIDNKASSAKEKEQKTECLWMNY